MSLYQLTIEPGTAYFDLHAKGSLVMPADDRAADLYDVTQELTEKPPACRPMKSRTMPQPDRSRGTICSTGAMANMPARAPARTAASTVAASAWPWWQSATRKPGAIWWSAKVMGS